ncbi:MAG: chemotaxis protein CheW [Clostridia bacterium BRH_c25]|nr:MAG: chemotaxis protein CheW [Clostridia bacterium BRH_c25]
MEAAVYTKQFVIFRLENEEYGIDILRVKEIKEMMRMTRVPKAAHFVCGVINLRGEIIPVIDLRKKFNLPDGEENNNTRIIIVAVDDITVGLVVDTSSEVIEISNSAIEGAPEVVGNVDQGFIYGIGKVGERLIILLDIVKIVTNFAV